MSSADWLKWVNLMHSDLNNEGRNKLIEISEAWSDEQLRDKWRRQKDANEFIVTDNGKKGKSLKIERRVDRVTIEVRLQRGDLTWVLREVARVPDGEEKPDRVRFSHPQGKVDGSDQELGDEMKWHNAAHRELLEETGFDLHLINENNERVFPETGNEDAEYVVRSFLSQCRESKETNHLGGTFPGITRITETRHYVGQLIEPTGKLIDLSEPIIEEEKEDGKIINRHFFRWFPSTEGFNTDFGEDSAGIQPTHPYDLLDALKQARRVHKDKNVKWKKLFDEANIQVKPETGKGFVSESQKWDKDVKFVATELDGERKSDTTKAGDIEWGIHDPKMQTKLHLGHRQSAMTRFNKILLRQARDSNKIVHPLIPYGQMTREFGLRVLSDANHADMWKNSDIRRDLRKKYGTDRKEITKQYAKKKREYQKGIWGEAHAEDVKKAPKPAITDWPKKFQKKLKEEKDLPKDRITQARKDVENWCKVHGYIIQALKIDCSSCDVRVGQPCPKPWATSLHGDLRKSRLPKGSRVGVPENYLKKITGELATFTTINKSDWDNDKLESKNGWENDWAKGFPLVCTKRLHAVSQKLDLEEMFRLAVGEAKPERAPERYLSSETVSPVTLRNRLTHSLQRYILQSRVNNKERYRIPKRSLHHALQHPIVELFDTNNWGDIEGVDMDDREQKEVELDIFNYSTEKRLHKSKRPKHKWTVFDLLSPGQNVKGQVKGFLPSVQVDAPLFEIFSAFSQGHPAVVIRRDYYVKGMTSDEEGKKTKVTHLRDKDGKYIHWPKPNEIPWIDEKFSLEFKDYCITPGQLIQHAAEARIVLFNSSKGEQVLQVRCALGVLEADTFLHKVLPSLLERLAKEKTKKSAAADEEE